MIRQQILDLLAQGLHPIVRIKATIFEDGFLDTSMTARVKAIAKSDDEMDSITFEFSEFLAENERLSPCNYYDKSGNRANLSAREAGCLPKDSVEDFYIMLDMYDTCLELKISPLYTRYLEEKSEKSYVEWLEERNGKTVELLSKVVHLAEMQRASLGFDKTPVEADAEAFLKLEKDSSK